MNISRWCLVSINNNSPRHRFDTHVGVVTKIVKIVAIIALVIAMILHYGMTKCAGSITSASSIGSKTSNWYETLCLYYGSVRGRVLAGLSRYEIIEEIDAMT